MIGLLEIEAAGRLAAEREQDLTAELERATDAARRTEYERAGGD